ncbi:unnamed protein product [Prorocentrum cordatum]|uniref:Uncharacterized protein n=1 Tax=Prorocentrum cordatum TaxID=2364126 RepID=A0ABN9XAB3_9DINO|nr:unnamed protein product [Polarella glacialis]
MCSVDLRRRVLPACKARPPRHPDHVGDDPTCQWETPVLTFPLTYVGGGEGDSSNALGENVGSVRISFGVSVDPSTILRAAEEAERPLLHRKADQVKQWIEKPVRWVAEASMAAGCQIDGDGCRQSRSFCGAFEAERPAEGAPVVRAPDLDRDGWVKHQGPNGRVFWHHIEAVGAASAAGGAAAGRGPPCAAAAGGGGLSASTRGGAAPQVAPIGAPPVYVQRAAGGTPARLAMPAGAPAQAPARAAGARVAYAAPGEETWGPPPRGRQGLERSRSATCALRSCWDAKRHWRAGG